VIVQGFLGERPAGVEDDVEGEPVEEPAYGEVIIRIVERAW
jgi:hypothetical protein